MTGPRIVALGDSISAGVGDATGPDAPHGGGWAAHLAQLAGASDFTNLARNGARAQHVVAEQLPHALDLLPDVATLVIGGNDVLRSDFSAYDVARDLSTTVTALRDCGCTVVLARLPAIALFELMPQRVRGVMRARIAAINDAVDAVAHAARPRTVEQVAAARRRADGRRPGQGTVVVVDIGAVVHDLGPAAWHSDRVHPSATAHRRLAVHAAITLGGAGLLAVPGTGGFPGTDAGAVAGGAGGLPRGGRPGTGADTVAALTERLAALPPAPSALARLGWLIVAGIPWCVRRGRDFVPGLVRALADDARGRAHGHALPLLSVEASEPERGQARTASLGRA
ncbi:GDSL-type esterase/lipase family protein [Xylanimonas allomyrinae]|uniref:GDSL-type esterase/lipase family protein n=1 Tax=Xylanimonas allomyrinae TaxID=2509459 RepID=UPI0013A5F981|nr:GDSL-type esterase/lipase family protein [Xylanimonas allomyrinae]